MSFEPDVLSENAFLDGRVRMLQPLDGFRSGADAVFLAASVPAKTGQTVLELGCGAGAAMMCLGWRVKLDLTGVELMADYAELARMNADLNQIKASVFNADIQDLPTELRETSFDHVMMNPPYFGPGTRSGKRGKATARLEETPLEHWLDVAVSRLRPKGWLTLIHRSESLARVLAGLSERVGKLEIKPLQSRVCKESTQFVLRAQKGRATETRICKPLILHEGIRHETDGDSYTEAAKLVLRCGKHLEF